MSKKVNLTTQVYEKIKAKILNNELKPNEYLDEKQICEQLGVSRTPVREALVQLEWEGFVVSNPHRGVSVSDLSLPMILELIHIRKVMEPELLRPYLKHYSRDVLLDFRAKMSAALEEKDMDMLRILRAEDNTVQTADLRRVKDEIALRRVGSQQYLQAWRKLQLRSCILSAAAYKVKRTNHGLWILIPKVCIFRRI